MKEDEWFVTKAQLIDLFVEERRKWSELNARALKEIEQLEARLQEMVNVFNAAGISMDKLPPEKLIELGGRYEKESK